MQDDNPIQDKAQDKAENIGNYASKHPRRMWTGAFLMGMGAGMLASKMKKDDRSSLQKFIDGFSD